MAILTIKQVTFGAGIPKVCVPIIGRTREEIITAAKQVRFLPCDVVEWRVDYYNDAKRLSRILETLTELRQILDRQLLLFTFRTFAEGGQTALGSYDYLWLNQKVAETGLPDLIDLEFAQNTERAESFVRFAHRNSVHVILSCHDFEKTPSRDEMVSLLVEMQKTQTDLVKLAVMPKGLQDVLTLMDVTLEMTTHHTDCPVITMSMGEEGLVSRLSGGIFGSCMTFGAAGEISAPGQPDVTDLSIALQILHRQP